MSSRGLNSGLILWLLSILFPIHIFCQSSQLQFNFQPVKVKDSEISSKELMALLQDSRGFIWIGTKAGLNVFDGHTYKVYKQNSKDSLSLGGDYIKSLMEDNLHRIVVNTNNTVDVYHPETGKFTHVSANINGTLTPNSTFAVHALQTRDGTIYFTSEDELYIFDPETETATELDVLKKEGFEARLSEYVNYTEDLQGTLWIPCRKKIAGYNKETEKIYYIDLADNPFFDGDQIFSIYLQSPGKLGLFSNAHHYIYDFNTKILQEENCYNLPSSFTGYKQLIKIFQDKNYTVWFTNNLESTILLFDPATMSFNEYPIVDENGRGFGQVRDILQDKQGIWWLATPHDGLFFSYPDNLNTFKHILSNSSNPISLNHNAVRSITKSMDGALWIGTDGGGLNIYDAYANSITTLMHNPEDSNSLASNSVLTIYRDSYGRMLLGGYNTGLAIYNFARKNFRNFLPHESDPHSISHHDVRSILEIDDGKYLIALNGGNGLEIFDINSQQFYPFEFDLNTPGGDIVSHWLLTIYKDNLNDIWLGGYGGLGKFDLENARSENYGAVKDNPKTLSNSWVYCILRDSEGILWVGTSFGLNRFNEDTKTFTYFFEEDGLPNNIICGIVEDADSNLWISTNKGISRLDKRTMIFSNYDASDGLKVDQFNQGAYFKDENGDIYFGGNGGLVYFDPSTFRKNTYKPPVYFTDFQISYRSVEVGKKDSPLKSHIAYTDKIVLNHKQNMITFNYVALNFMSPGKNTYECMLEGLDEDWNKVGNRREATYTNLHPGKYTFHVRATNNDGILNEQDASIDIIISPPWYKRWWFRISVILAVFWIVFRLIRERESATRRDKEILRKKIDEGKQELQKQKDEIELQRRELIEKEARESESKWYNEAMVHLSEIVNSNSSDLHKMGRELISGIISQVDANLGAIYILNDTDEQDIFFEQVGHYAVDKNKLKSRFEISEGYLGALYKERTILPVDNLPAGYAKLKSGLGQIDLKYLLLIPLVQDQKLNGAIELASKEKIPDYKVDLLEKLAKNLASSIEVIKVNERMQGMFEKLNAHTEELNAQKEYMQQNLEEINATQEEIERTRKEEQKKNQELERKNETLKKFESENKVLREKYNKILKKYEKLTLKKK